MHRLFAFVLVLLFPLAAAASNQTLPTGVSRIGAAGAGVEIDADVAVIDTGVDYYNPELNIAGGYDCTQPLTEQSNYPFAMHYTVQGAPVRSDIKLVASGGPSWQDGAGHGTHVSGIIGARDNGFGVIGVAPGARIWAIKVLTDTGWGTTETVNCGLQWVLDHADVIDVVNMSLGASASELAEVATMPCMPKDYEPITRISRKAYAADRQLICQIQALGIPVVVAAGNADEEVGYHYPAGYPEPISVSNFSDFDGKPGGLGKASDTACVLTGGTDDTLWTAYHNTPLHEWTSSYGKGIDISAPGTCILSTVPGGYAEFVGTSMAAPHVTGVIARYKANHPDAGFDEIRTWLLDNADPQPPNFDIDNEHEPLLRLGTP